MKEYSFAIKTLGCKVNQYEEQVMREKLLAGGFSEARACDADVVIVNSCTVTGRADLKTRKLIRKLKKDNPGSKLFVTGCYAVFDEDKQLLGDIPEVDIVVPNTDKTALPDMICSSLGLSDTSLPRGEEVSGFGSHTRAFVKIQDGCDQRCAYCKVSLVRGPSRSRDEDEVIRELRRLAERGYREIVLTGICLGSWRGKGGRTIADLLDAADAELKERGRLRLSSIEPNHIDGRLIAKMASSGTVCRHLHIPLQSGSDRILRAMRRNYDTARFKGIIEKVRRAMPSAGITMDVIVGFPGETEADFEGTIDLIKEVSPSRLHVFNYSDRKGTVAYKMPGKVPSSVAKKRVEKLITLGKRFQADFCAEFIGRDVDVLIEESAKDGMLEGYTGEYVRVKMTGLSGSGGDIVKLNTVCMDESEPCLVFKGKEPVSKAGN